jgi:fatty-acyl-CoA synthase/long-chain acyl-CoA synthetase
MDEEGYVFLKDRKGDIVITGGLNVYCQEVEDVLGRHEQVRSVAVLGIPHEDWGESVHACVISRDSELTEAELIGWARQHMAGYAVPKSVEFVSELPETTYGKVDKNELRARFWKGHDRVIS